MTREKKEVWSWQVWRWQAQLRWNSQEEKSFAQAEQRDQIGQTEGNTTVVYETDVSSDLFILKKYWI